MKPKTNTTHRVGKKEWVAWCMYDWANSVYSLVVTTTVFPIYYAAVARTAAPSGLLDLGALALPPAALFSYTLSAAFLLVAFINPALSGIADAAGRRLVFMKRFCYLGGLSCMGLAAFAADTFWLGPLFFFLATVGFSGSLVFYNAYLPQLAAPADRDRLSALGFSYGYVGSVLLQILVLIPILMPDLLGTTVGTATRWAFVATGLWWLGFAQIPFARLPQDARSHMPLGRAIRHGFKVVVGTYNRIKTRPLLLGFLAAYMFYNMGVQTIMYLATLFGTDELHLTDAQLIPTLLALQVLAIGGALGTARLSARFGPISVLTGLLILWMGICMLAYFIATPLHFYVLASAVGLMMGGVQSLSRSTWARFLPVGSESRAASYFSFFDLVDKVSIVAGTLVYGLLHTATGSMRVSALALGVCFAIGVGLLQRVRPRASAQLSQ